MSRISTVLQSLETARTHQLSSTLALPFKSIVCIRQLIIIVGRGIATVVIHDKLSGAFHTGRTK